MSDNILAFVRLNLHVAMPDLEETWLDGYQTAMVDLPEENNPYPMSSQEYECWSEGWWAGYYQEQPLFTLAGRVNLVSAPVPKEQTAVSKPQTIKARKYIIRVMQVLGTLLAAAVCYQLLDFITF